MDISRILDNIEHRIVRCEENKTIERVDFCERLLRISRPDVQADPTAKARWSELCRRVAVVRDILSPPLLTGASPEAMVVH